MKLKKWITGGILIAGIAVQFSFTMNNKDSNEIGLYNIEALTSGEVSSYCDGTGSLDCPTSPTKVLAIYSL